MLFLPFPSNKNNNLPETPRSIKIPNTFNYGKKTVKRRQKDGKRTAKRNKGNQPTPIVDKSLKFTTHTR